jgi:hypothetical protein
MSQLPIFVDPYDGGFHAENPPKTFQDASTVCIRPCLSKGVHPRVFQTWENLMTPMNQRFIRMTPVDMEVGEAYSQCIAQILEHPDLSKWKFILTLEHDNCPPPDGLLKLLAAMEEYPELSAIGGLYHTKGFGGQPMIYGNPKDTVFNFQPLPAVPDALVECNGLGMGFTLFRMDLFRDEQIERPWFRTVQEVGPEGAKAYTQDLWFFEKARRAGHRFACHCGVRVGHYDYNTNEMW